MKRRPITRPPPGAPEPSPEPARAPPADVPPTEKKSRLAVIKEELSEGNYVCETPSFPDDELDYDDQPALERYTNDMPQDTAEYAVRGFYLVGDVIPTVEGLARFFGVTSRTIRTWAGKYPPFMEALEFLKSEQKRRLINHGLTGTYSMALVKTLLSSLHDISEKQDHVSSDGSMSYTKIEREIVYPKPLTIENDGEA